MLIIIHLFPSEFLFFFPLKEGLRGWCSLNSPVYRHDKHVKGPLHSSGVSNGTSRAKPVLPTSLSVTGKQMFGESPSPPAAWRPTRCTAGSTGSPHWLQSVHRDLSPVCLCCSLHLTPHFAD